jgi:hypothetical protein
MVVGVEGRRDVLKGDEDRAKAKEKGEVRGQTKTKSRCRGEDGSVHNKSYIILYYN